MIKTGIHSLRGLISGKGDSTLFRKELKNVSISLYQAVCTENDADTLTQRIFLLFSDDEARIREDMRNALTRLIKKSVKF